MLVVKMFRYLRTSCLFLIISLVRGDVVTFLCSEAFCDDFDCANANSNVPENCRIQNSTHSGVFLPYPGPCDCCDYCLRNLDEGDTCSVGEAGQPPTATICGNLLYCEPGENELDQGSCQQITDTDCAKKQVDFDRKVADGTVGHLELKEICDRRGLYGHYKCVPGEICYCRNDVDERIFGEIPFTSIADHLMNCACSASYEKTSKFFERNLHVGEYLRCQPNGDYDPIQCIDDLCFCVDASDGAATYLDALPVNVTEISNETLPCFDHKMHLEGEYYRPCELEYLETLEIVSGYEDDNVVIIGATYPNCQLDGYYGPIQNNDTHYYCSDGYGNVLEDFALPKEDPLIKDMNCVCARARSLIDEDWPECLRNGNYNPVQCRRGLCRCVDGNGNQIKKEIPISDIGYTEYVEACNNL